MDPNGTESFITKIENMPLTDYLTLFDVLDLRAEKHLGTHSQFGGLYYFDGNQAKLTTKPFPLSDHVSTKIGELGHLDLWRPYKGGLPLNMWTDCVLAATYLINKLSSSVLNGKSPFELIYKRLASLKHLRDVKFFEDIFPFEQKVDMLDKPYVLGLNNLNLFDLDYLNDHSDVPNDEEKSDPSPNSEEKRSANHEDSQNIISKGYGPLFSSQNDQDIPEIQNLKSFEPKSFEDAAKHHPWVDAMNSEIDAFHRNNTWDLVDLLQGRKAIVANGFNQREEINFDKTFFPVVKIVTARCLINLAVQNGWTLFQMDVNNAFLYVDLNETVYMALPPGYFLKKETKFMLGDVKALQEKDNQNDDKEPNPLLDAYLIPYKR
ncbi:ribonuclease H-like domain-containing protein [Tanacetum coccineum]